ncbi:MAG: hypothetical protein M5R38_04115 [Candidatus Methylomirabilis sp.]|nr:hypothetical protein [Candidatus Methylomirabilis sp.]
MRRQRNGLNSCGGEEKFGFKLDREGILSYRGKMLTPKLEVHGELGDSRYPPPKVVISRLSPSGRYAFVKACEASDESALCWFLYLIDTKRGQMLLTFAGKYGPKDGIKWSPDEAYAIVPYSSEGATWLYGIDLVTGKSEEISMWHLAKSDGRWICPGESGLVVDAESLSWRENNKRFYIKVEVQCSSHDYQETQVARRYEIAVDVPSFHVEVLSRKAPTPVYAKASPPDFLTSTTIDPETQVRFSLIRGKGCRRSWGYRVEVIGEVPKSSDVLNDNLVRGILEKARDFAVNLCPLFKSGSDSVHGDFIEVYLLIPRLIDSISAHWTSPSSGASPFTASLLVGTRS